MNTSQILRNAGTSGAGRGCLAAALICVCLLLAPGCGTLRPVPEPFDAQAYTPIDYQDLLHPDQAGLHDAQKVRVQAYYWQRLTYDPAIVSNYLTLARYPVEWYQLRWSAIYGAEDMHGYYDLVAMTKEQVDRYKLKRMEPIMIYGEISKLSPGLYLLVHHIEKIPPS
jgi:hypothetical protein